MWRRQKKATAEPINTAPALSLQAADQSIQISFSNKVVNNIRQLLARIESRTDLSPKVGVFSALREEGVSYITQALGTVIANHLGVDVCLVDLNWWNTAYPSEQGISDVISGRQDLDDILVSTNYPNLSFVPAGELSIAQRPVVARSEALKNVLVELEERFDYLILDIPAILSSSDAVPLATLADMNCFVIHQGATASSNVRLALDEVRHLPLLGVIMNQSETYTPPTLLNLLPIE